MILERFYFEEDLIKMEGLSAQKSVHTGTLERGSRTERRKVTRWKREDRCAGKRDE